MQPATPLSTAQLATCIRVAQQELARLKAECVQSGALLIDGETVERLETELQSQGGAISVIRRRLWLARFRLIGIELGRVLHGIRVTLHRAIVASQLPWSVIGLIGGTACLLAGLVAAAIVGLSPTTAICASIF